VLLNTAKTDATAYPQPANFFDHADGFRYAVMDGTARETTRAQCLADTDCDVCQQKPIEMFEGWAVVPYSLDILTEVVKEETGAFDDATDPFWGTYYIVLSNNVAYSTGDVHAWGSSWLIKNGSAYSTRDCWAKVLIRTPRTVHSAHCHLGSAFGGVGYGCVKCGQSHADDLPADGCANMKVNCKYQLHNPINCPVDWSLWIWGKKMPFDIPQAVALIMAMVIFLSIAIPHCFCRGKKKKKKEKKKKKLKTPKALVASDAL
jgi:hypothetical protein